jgi:hypothetical protein
VRPVVNIPHAKNNLENQLDELCYLNDYRNEMATNTAMEVPPDIRECHIGRLIHQLALLKCVRPFRGSRLDATKGEVKEANESGTPLHLDHNDDIKGRVRKTNAFVTNTTRLDVLLTVLRQLLSFDIKIEARSDIEKAVVDATLKDIGWVAAQDLNLKYDFVRKFLSLETASHISEMTWEEPTLSFEQLVKNPNLAGLVRENPDFRFFSLVAAKADGESYEMVNFEDVWAVHLQDSMIWDGEKALEAFIDGQFQTSKVGENHPDELTPFPGRPKFVRIVYEGKGKGKGKGRKFADMETFRFHADTVWREDTKAAHARQDTLYIVQAVVRLRDPESSTMLKIWTMFDCIGKMDPRSFRLKLVTHIGNGNGLHKPFTKVSRNVGASKILEDTCCFMSAQTCTVRKRKLMFTPLPRNSRQEAGTKNQPYQLLYQLLQTLHKVSVPNKTTDLSFLPVPRPYEKNPNRRSLYKPLLRPNPTRNNSPIVFFESRE